MVERESGEPRNEKREVPYAVLRLTALGAALLLLVGSLWSMARVARYPRQLNLAEPELAALPASDVARIRSGGPRLARRVVVCIADGLRLTEAKNLAFLGELESRGASYQADAGFPTFTRAGLHVIATGVDQGASGVRLNNPGVESRFDNVFARARAAGLRSAALGNGVGWLGQMFAHDIDLAVFGPGFERALEEALDGQYQLVVVHLVNADKAGHAHGAASPAYKAAARVVDARIGKIVSRLDLAQDAVVVVADHGHVPQGGHGGVEEDARLVPLVAAGAGIRRGARGSARLVDVAPTVATLLGLAVPAQIRGWPLFDALELTEEERLKIWQSVFWTRARAERFLGGLWRARRTLDLRRDEALSLLAAGDHETALRIGEATVREETERAVRYSKERRAATVKDRLWRAGLILVGAVLLMVVLARLGLIETGWRVLFGAIGPVLALAGARLFLGPFSFSIVRTKWLFVGHFGLVLALAALVHFTLASLATGSESHRRVRRATGLALASGVFAMLPALVCFVVVGSGPVHDLPPPMWTFLPFVCYPAAALMLASATLFVVVEARSRG